MTAALRSEGTSLDPHFDVTSDVESLSQDGIVGVRARLLSHWAEQMREDMMTAFWAAIQRRGGAVGCGPRRWYVEIHPQDLSGFVDLVTHAWVRDRRITSLAFNLTGVDVTPDMGPFEVAPGTQYDDGREWKHEMFPPQRSGHATSSAAYESTRRWATSRAARP
jgi:hypothetical protein